ncbi:MAG: hypothetical protein FMNOHCHN_02629 [Ignavibacteriaceae bacterium]|nr:hypothetical protein [Ignavibacteriaceae bacterium]
MHASSLRLRRLREEREGEDSVKRRYTLERCKVCYTQIRKETTQSQKSFVYNGLSWRLHRLYGCIVTTGMHRLREDLHNQIFFEFGRCFRNFDIYGCSVRGMAGKGYRAVQEVFRKELYAVGAESVARFFLGGE